MPSDERALAQRIQHFFALLSTACELLLGGARYEDVLASKRDRDPLEVEVFASGREHVRELRRSDDPVAFCAGILIERRRHRRNQR